MIVNDQKLDLVGNWTLRNGLKAKVTAEITSKRGWVGYYIKPAEGDKEQWFYHEWTQFGNSVGDREFDLTKKRRGEEKW